MKTRVKNALYLSVTLCLALTACGSPAAKSADTQKSGAVAQSSPTPLSPSDALQATLATLASTSYDVTAVGAGAKGSGSVDPTGKAANFLATTPIGGGETLKMDTVVIGAQVYLKIDAGKVADRGLHLNPAKWMLVDLKKLGDDVALPLDTADTNDPLDVDGLLQGVSDVHRTDATHYTGTLDLTKAGGVSGPDPDDLTKAGSKAKAVPFTATLDDKGRLLTLVVNASKAGKDLSVTLRFSHYGAAKAVAKPSASSIIQMPAGIYTMLNS